MMEIVLVFLQIRVLLQIQLFWSFQVEGGKGNIMCVLLWGVVLPSRSGSDSRWSVPHVTYCRLYINIHNSMVLFSGGGGLCCMLDLNPSLCCSTCLDVALMCCPSPQSWSPLVTSRLIYLEHDGSLSEKLKSWRLLLFLFVIHIS